MKIKNFFPKENNFFEIFNTNNKFFSERKLFIVFFIKIIIIQIICFIVITISICNNYNVILLILTSFVESS